jgi:hypothetical protein
MAVAMNNSVFWEVMLCSVVKVYRCFGGRYYLHLQDGTNVQDVSASSAVHY